MSLSSPSFEDARLVIQDRLADAAHEALVQQALSASRRPLSMAAVHPPFVSVRSTFAGTRPRYAAVGPRLAAVRRSSLAVRPRLATALRALASRLDPSLALNA
ncbi:MAG: hypothetical protein JO318_14815 [Chloroflexi bacterium]|nr:hypothetical protein [Chloroflexota bacterium]